MGTRGRLAAKAALLVGSLTFLVALAPPPACIPVNPTPSPTPPVGAALDGLSFPSNEWKNPFALPSAINLPPNPANGCPSHEDSPFISWDGTTLFFAYSVWNVVSGNCVGPARGIQSVTNPPSEATHPGFDIYEAQIVNGAWELSNAPADLRYDNVNTGKPDGAVGARKGQQLLVWAYFYRNPEPSGPQTSDLYYAFWNGTNSQYGPRATPPASSGVNTACKEDNPHVVGPLESGGYDHVVYFDSDRDPSGSGCTANPNTRQIYTATVSLSPTIQSVAAPVLGKPRETTFTYPDAGSPTGFTTVPFAVHAFLPTDMNTIYWVGGDALGCPQTSLCIYSATRSGSSSAGPYDQNFKLVIKGNSPAINETNKVISVGEPSVTGDGKYLYFVYTTKTQLNPLMIDASVGVVERLTP